VLNETPLANLRGDMNKMGSAENFANSTGKLGYLSDL
jgi:hypothetical protein